MNHNMTEIVMVLDKSGSMRPLASETIVNFNNFIKEQKAVPGEASLTVVLFDTQWKKILDGVRLSEVSDSFLDCANYRPDGYTALFDAVGSTIDAVGRRLAATPENDRPGNVIFVVMTDGDENSSKEFNKGSVLARIQKQENDYSWKFLYLGCSAEQMAAGASIGVQSRNMMAYSHTPAGVMCAFKSISNYSRSLRTGIHDPQLAPAAQNKPPTDFKLGAAPVVPAGIANSAIQ